MAFIRLTTLVTLTLYLLTLTTPSTANPAAQLVATSLVATSPSNMLEPPCLIFPGSPNGTVCATTNGTHYDPLVARKTIHIINVPSPQNPFPFPQHNR